MPLFGGVWEKKNGQRGAEAVAKAGILPNIFTNGEKCGILFLEIHIHSFTGGTP